MLSFCIFYFLLFFAINKIKFSKLSLFQIQKQPKREIFISIENLPQELLSNILSRLPSSHLIKCKCVSKSWFNLINDPYFTTNYYYFHNNVQIQEQNENLLVISSLKTRISFLSLKFNDPKKHVSSVSSVFLNTPKNYISENKYWSEIMGPCNGIYFLEGNPNVIMNPSLRQFKSLPESHLTDSNDIFSLTDYSGFGFDPKTNDYKIIVLRDVWLKQTNERQKGYWRAELYSLNSNSWRILDAKALPRPIEFRGSSSRVYTFVNKCCHWWSFVNNVNDFEDIKQDYILSFDMVNNVFRKIKVLPRICDFSGENFATLVPFEESSTIGVIVYPIKGNVKEFDVWIMRDYWDEGSWIKQYSFGTMEVIDRFMGFIGRNSFLWKCKGDELVMHEHDSKKVKYYGNFDDSLRVVVYKESLVSLLRKDLPLGVRVKKI